MDTLTSRQRRLMHLEELDRRFLQPIIHWIRERDDDRDFVLADGVVRDVVPQCLAAVGWSDQESRLRASPPVVDEESRHSAWSVCVAIRAEILLASPTRDENVAEDLAYAAVAGAALALSNWRVAAGRSVFVAVVVDAADAAGVVSAQERALVVEAAARVVERVVQAAHPRVS